MSVLMRIASRNLVLAKRRSLFLGVALFSVTVLLVLLLSLSQGLTETMVKTSTTLTSGHVNVGGWYKLTRTSVAPMLKDVRSVREIVEKNTPGTVAVVDRALGWARIISEASSVNGVVTGIDVEEEKQFIETIRLAKESEYSEGGKEEVLGNIRSLSEPNTMMLFAAQAKKLGVGVGDILTAVAETEGGVHNTLEVTVVAVAKDLGMMSNWSMFSSKQTVRSLYTSADSVSGVIQIHLEDHKKSKEVMGHLRQVLTDAGHEVMEHDPQPYWMKFERVAGEDWTGQQLDLTIWSDEISYVLWFLKLVDGLSFFLTGVLMMIIAVGITNSMWISVRERTTEIGTMRAIGMSRIRVLWMFLIEAMLLGLVATGLGAVIGAAIAASVDAAQIEIPVAAVQAILMADTLHLSITAPPLVGTVIVFTMIAGLAALWPAYRASKMQPVTAIHHIG